MKIDANPVFPAPVKLTVPGKEVLAELVVTWKHKDRDALKEWAARPLRVGETGVVASDVEAEYIAEVMADWKGPVDAAGVPVPFSLAALSRLMQTHPIAGQELYSQYLKEMTESRLKNSGGRPGT